VTDRIAVAGDSAGGNIAAVMALLAAITATAAGLSVAVVSVDHGRPVAAVVHRERRRAHAESRRHRAFVAWYVPAWISATQRHCRHLSRRMRRPVRPAARLHRHRGIRPAARRRRPIRRAAQGAGVPVELCNEPTLVHGYVSFALVIPAAAEAAIVDWRR